jgi:hypothetical protein
VRPSIVPFLYSKRTAAARSLVSRYGRSIVLWPLRLYHSWTYPTGSSHVRSAALVKPRAPRALTPLTGGEPKRARSNARMRYTEY